MEGLKLVNYKPFYSVVNFRNVFGSMTEEAKQFVAENEQLNNLKLKEFFLVNSLPLRLLVRGYLSINKPKTKTIVLKNTKELIINLNKEISDNLGIKELEEYLAKLQP